jgi:hypothetical protein
MSNVPISVLGRAAGAGNAAATCPLFLEMSNVPFFFFCAGWCLDAAVGAYLAGLAACCTRRR